MDGHHSKAVNYRSPVVGNGFAPAGRRPMDLQKVHGERWRALSTVGGTGVSDIRFFGGKAAMTIAPRNVR